MNAPKIPSLPPEQRFETDQRYRSARRNLVWTSLAAILFACARPSTDDIYEFQFSLVGVGGGFHRAAFALGLLVAILFLIARFWHETQRVKATLNSQAAVIAREVRCNYNHTAGEYLLGQVAGDFDLAANTIRKSLESIDERVSILIDQDKMSDALSELRHDLLSLRNNIGDPLAALNSVERQIENFSLNPMGFYPDPIDREAIESTHRTLKTAISQLDFLKDQKFDPNRNFEKSERGRILKNEIDIINSAQRLISKEIDSILILRQNISVALQASIQLSEKINDRDKFFFTILDQIATYGIALFGSIGCFIWIFSWLCS